MTHLIKPYGDTAGDGRLQISFTLPVQNSDRARKAAEIYLAQLNLDNITVAHTREISPDLTFIVAYASAIPEIDFDRVEVKAAAYKPLDFYEINHLIRVKLKRKMVVVGATIGSDAHTVGIDAIMNMKGYNQDYGLERYDEIEAINLGAQVEPELLIEVSMNHMADTILVSQTVTQKDAHLCNFTELVELLEAASLRERFILVAGGARVTNELAIELGYDAGFGMDTRPSQVASFLVQRLLKKLGIDTNE